MMQFCQDGPFNSKSLLVLIYKNISERVTTPGASSSVNQTQHSSRITYSGYYVSRLSSPTSSQYQRWWCLMVDEVRTSACDAHVGGLKTPVSAWVIKQSIIHPSENADALAASHGEWRGRLHGEPTSHLALLAIASVEARIPEYAWWKEARAY